MSVKKILKVKRLSEDSIIPSYANPGDAGMDLYSVENVEITPGEIKLVRTGISIELHPGFEAQIRPRSGWALKQGITVLNSPGTIDEGFRGEVKIILINHGNETVFIFKRDRIAQIVINKVESVKVEEIEELSETERGSGGFGSSGK